MRNLIIALSSALAFGLPAQAADPSSQENRSAAPSPAAVPISPFLRFAAQHEPRKSDVSPARTSEAGKPRTIDIVVSTPTSQFGHMRTGSSNALLECIVPGILRRDDLRP